ncbi:MULTISPECIES: RdgB/HAM1 family non-canonical purine NTP pyrophosphatase [Bacillota]|jgi:non-canonical purine NTP pyrophosphatase (RdgB/HAM1 family)|uniref:dITP/XTP pyrophosphatase n=2 Tax=Amedibacillus TaxID=2749846 RepID=A0A7G9GLA1_9FIRM|nr:MULTISPECIES: RdgB/HAM1 family non-canonical purine NTP pyrophosphatase [Bacillota]QNM11583.1 RdgB/HAM1 family non-canonical purine NTP pyrophosphatase [[Eubacterium] hominis]MCH4285172.1 RdgB/HAM1 family non-canonical purine NTP pyrophosphatase [Amedibacillus hominis]RGB56200.1 RdgB/HAM1 family non-canonical purine NTP pyrophosphatase [Absiella sp. AM22-9]RGB61961.1 RdgB/HAM1 family non-canonical purine NTP pyrophosphatase [Absiella sp. AM10-20]RGB70217.1 RdgB/HAM1 family non-canonical pur
MKQIMIATSNAHKVEEFKRMLQPYGYEVRSLLDLDEEIDIEENGTTFEENALIKAKTIYDKLHIEVIADDSGLAVNAMNGEPGIYSARFLGRDTSYDVKNQYIIDQVKDAQDKGAQFVCAIAYIDADGHENVFTGVVEGEIYDHIEGAKGFGYDPIFYYPPFKTTLANVSEDQKNEVSHRGKAIQMLLNYMKEGK